MRSPTATRGSKQVRGISLHYEVWKAVKRQAEKQQSSVSALIEKAVIETLAPLDSELVEILDAIQKLQGAKNEL